MSGTIVRNHLIGKVTRVEVGLPASFSNIAHWSLDMDRTGGPLEVESSVGVFPPAKPRILDKQSRRKGHEDRCGITAGANLTLTAGRDQGPRRQTESR